MNKGWRVVMVLALFPSALVAGQAQPERLNQPE
jgi:hypothetical protein